jgi:hypothetical protein
MIRFIFINLLRFLLIWWANFWKSCHSTMNWFRVTFDDQIWSFTTYSRKKTSSSLITCRLKDNWSTTNFCVWYFSCEDKMIRNWIMLVTLKKRWSLKLTRNRNFVNDDDILTINWKENNSKNESERWNEHDTNKFAKFTKNTRSIYVMFLQMIIFCSSIFLYSHSNIFFLYERFSFHTNDYKRTIKLAFEYSSQRHARSSRSNDMFFNIVYVRNVNIRVTKNRFRKQSSSNN